MKKKTTMRQGGAILVPALQNAKTEVSVAQGLAFRIEDGSPQGLGRVPV